MKRYIAFLMALLLTLSLASCGKKYEPQESTEEEKRVVMTLSLGRERYDVRYELYRALFLNYKSDIDGGDSSVWSSDKKAEYIDRINEKIFDKVSEIYAAFYLCEDIGINVFSSDYDKRIDDYIDASVKSIIAEVKSTDEKKISDDEGYAIYLQRLRDTGFSYEAHILLFRYDFAVEEINKYYLGTFNEESPNPNDEKGKLEYTKDDVTAYYNSDESVRVLEAVIKSTEDIAVKVREQIAAVADEGDFDKIAGKMVGYSMTPSNEAKNGIMIGRYPEDRGYLGYTEAAFALSVGELSSIITVKGEESTEYYILYRCEKSAEHLEKCYSAVESSYRLNAVARIKEQIRTELEASAKLTEAYSSLIHADIK